jgi:sodium transport system permease protein
MNRFSRVNTIWRKELIDTLRDRRTLIAMILVPMVLYPAMLLGSVQGFELQYSRLQQEVFDIGVTSEDGRVWLQHMLDQDAARNAAAAGKTAEEVVELSAQGALADDAPATSVDDTGAETPTDGAQVNVKQRPPKYNIVVLPDAEEVRAKVKSGELHVGILSDGGWPMRDARGSARFELIYDETDYRSRIAAWGLEGVLQRANDVWLSERLERAGHARDFIQPIAIEAVSIATPEKVSGSLLGRIVPLILIIMTITGAIYPAIDLTAGERERGTLETLMVAPVPTVDLIAGKFVVVTLIAMLSALLNLLSIGGTVYFGGLGDMLGSGGVAVIPLDVLPLVLLVLIPLAVMFSAALLAVCSFARSFKEAQNYVMPVMVAGMIPAIVGMLPGMRLEGPLLIMPVTNIVILTRDLFTGIVAWDAIVWVLLSTSLYAGAAVAIAAKLFGQEAVLFADSGSIKTIFQRRFFKPRNRPAASHAFLLLALTFSLNFFIQQSMIKQEGLLGTIWYWIYFAILLVVLFIAFPAGAAAYARVRLSTAFSLQWPAWRGFVAAACLGLSTWVLARAWFVVQSRWLPIGPEMEAEFQRVGEMLTRDMSPLLVFLFMALVPAVCEELFFRGYALSGLRGGLGKWAAVAVTAIAFGLHHHSVFRLAITSGLGLLFGLLVIQYRSVWPAILAHLMHNGISVLSADERALKPLLDRLGFAVSGEQLPPLPWLAGAAVLTAIGVLIALWAPARDVRPPAVEAPPPEAGVPAVGEQA